MNRFIMTFIYSFLVINMFAQTYYYDDTETFYEDGYTYKCDVIKKAKFVRLYNKENKFTYVNQCDKNTGEGLTVVEERNKQLEDDTWTVGKCLSIVNNAFSEIEKQRLKGKYITIILYVNSTTGKIDEVEYQLVSFGPYATIPVSVYRKVELELKKNVWYTPTSDGRKLNYIYLSWLHQIK